MRLAKFECQGFKRFRGLQRLDLDPRVVCVVGPNASGKSSLLDALELLTTDRGIDQRQRTRGLASTTQTYLLATFDVDDLDKEAINHVREARRVRHVLLRKDFSETRIDFDPPVLRDRRPRGDVNERLTKYRDSGAAGTAAAEQEDPDAFEHLLSRVFSITTSTDESLASSALDDLDQLAGLIAASSLPHRFRGLPKALRDLLAREREDHPHDRTRQALLNRVPVFRTFLPTQRELRSGYDLSEEPNLAVENLLTLAGTSWSRAREVYESGNAGQKETWENDAATLLAQRITAAWQQSEIRVRLRIDSNWLQVVMSIESDEFFDIEEHSDGLLQFVALRAFLAAQSDVRPTILLIDEAETHLHYNAQADVVSLLEEEREVAGVVYTTHSAGCLPRDLGVGIRGVVPIYSTKGTKSKQTNYSEFLNSFWEHGSDFSPLLLAMGASAFAFASARHAVVTEGLSDAMLLPSMIRAALGEDKPLEYQIVPGFSEASANDIARLDLLGARVAYVVDGDGGGKDNAKHLMRNGVLKEQIVFLGGRNSGLSIEDVLPKKLYIDSVNAELARLSNSARVKSVPAKGRSAAVKRFFKGKRDDAGRSVQPYKVNVAQRVLERRDGKTPFIDGRQRKRLVRLDAELKAIFAKAPHQLGQANQPDAT